MTQNDEGESDDPLADSEDSGNVKSKRSKSPAKGNGAGTSLGRKHLQYNMVATLS